MLTGDKLETATSIALSSRLISRMQTIFTFKQVLYYFIFVTSGDDVIILMSLYSSCGDVIMMSCDNG